MKKVDHYLEASGDVLSHDGTKNTFTPAQIQNVNIANVESFLPFGSMWTDTRDGQVNSCSHRIFSVGHWLGVQHLCI